ncbi:MAG: archease [Actinomycetota bacterium]|nr:archease [Actinomycetota bacterium]
MESEKKESRPRPFEVIEHTADVGIIGYGGDLKEVFENTAIGMFSLITELNAVSKDLEIQVEVEAEDVEGLMVAWLNELIYLFETKGVLFKEFDILELSEEGLRAVARGEELNPIKHEIKTEIKAATYHMLKVESEKERLKSRVIFDV